MSDAVALLASALAPVVRRLRRHRRVRDLLWTTTVVLAAGTVGQVAARVAAADERWVVGTAAAVALVATVTVLRGAHRRDPIDAHVAARRVERDPTWRERLSTTLEVGNRPGTITDALRADARARVDAVDAVATVPWRWPRRAVAAASAAVVVFLLSLSVVSPAGGLGSSGFGARTGGSDAPSAEAVGELARDLAAEARRSRDAYLGALAEELQELADAVGAGPLDAPAQAALEQLLEAVANASAGALTADALRERLEARDDELAARAASADPDAASPDARSDVRPPRMGADGAAQDFGDVFTSVREGVPEEHPETASIGGAGPAQDSAQGAFDPASLEEGRDASQFDGPGPSGGEAEVIGAAEEAGAGASLLAGRGSQALEGDAAAADFADASAEAVTLSGSERDEGRRIEVELPPSTEWEGYDSSAFAIGAWRAGPEAAVASDPTPLAHREAAGRYFLPSQETNASR